MAQSKKDENRVPTLIGVDKDDLTVPALIAVNPENNALIVEVAEE